MAHDFVIVAQQLLSSSGQMSSSLRKSATASRSSHRSWAEESCAGHWGSGTNVPFYGVWSTPHSG